MSSVCFFSFVLHVGSKGCFGLFLIFLLVSVLALRTPIFLSVASCRLSLLPFIQVSEDSDRRSHTVVVDVFVADSVTRFFFFFFTVPGC